MPDVRVRTETPMLGLSWHQELTLTRTPLVDAAIADGRLTVLEELAGPGLAGPGLPAAHAGPLAGDALDEALAAHGLPRTGQVRHKRGRLTRHLREEHPDTVLAANLATAEDDSETGEDNTPDTGEATPDGQSGPADPDVPPAG